jgi:hypothetical protein
VRKGQDERTTKNRDKRATNGGVKRGDKSALGRNETPKKNALCALRMLDLPNAPQLLRADAEEPCEEGPLVAEVFDDAHGRCFIINMG